MNSQDPREMYRRNYKIKLKAINAFISRYEQFNGKAPSEELLRQFYNCRHYQYPLPSEEEYINNMISSQNVNMTSSSIQC